MNVFNFELFPNEFVDVLLHEVVVNRMCNLAEEAIVFIGIKIIADDPVRLYAQKGEITGSIYLDRSPLIDNRVSYLLTA